MKRQTIMTSAILIAGVLGISLAAAGFGNGFMNNLSDEEKQEMIDNQNAICQAIQNDDYETWESLMLERVAQLEDRITPETFQELQDNYQSHEDFRQAMRDAKESGDWQAMQDLHEEYGMEGNYGRLGMHRRFWRG